MNLTSAHFHIGFNVHMVYYLLVHKMYRHINVLLKIHVSFQLL